MEITQFNNFRYVFVEGLSDELEEALAQEYQLEELDIEDIFTNTQLSKIESRKEYMYVAFQFPEFDKSKGRFIIKEVHCVINEKTFILIDKNSHRHTLQFNNFKRTLFDDVTTSYDLFYEMLDFFVTKDFQMIGKFRAEIADLEKDIFCFEIQNDLVKDILILKRNLYTFYSAVIPLRILVTELQEKYSKNQSTHDLEKLDDTLDKIKKMVNNLDTLHKYARLLSEANNAQIARSTNEVIRTLTSISIIALIPTIIFSLFGMNVFFGWSAESNPFPFLGIIVLSVALTGIVYYYFKKRDWI